MLPNPIGVLLELSTEEVMKMTIEANHRAKNAEEEGKDSLPHYLEKYQGALIMGLFHGADIETAKTCEGISLKLKSNPNKAVHLPSNEMRKIIQGNGFDPRIRSALLQIFRLKPTASARTRAETSRAICASRK